MGICFSSELKITSSQLVKADDPTLTPKIIKFSHLDTGAVKFFFIAGAFFFPSHLPIDPLIISLKRVLNAFPQMTGKIQVNNDLTELFHLVNNNEGILFEQAEAKKWSLNDFKQPINQDVKGNRPKRNLKDLINMPGQFLQELAIKKAPLFTLRVTYFEKGCSLGFYISHIIVDGYSLDKFFTLWFKEAEKISGQFPFPEPIERITPFPTSRQILDPLVDKLNEKNGNKKPVVSANLHMLDWKGVFKTILGFILAKKQKYLIHLAPEKVEKLVKEGSGEQWVSLVDVLQAKIWKALALNSLKRGKNANLTTTIDIRKRFDLPEYSIGNLILSRCIKMPENLIDMSLHEAACFIRNEMKKENLMPHLTTDLLYLYQNAIEKRRIHCIHNYGNVLNFEDLAVSSWLGFHFFDNTLFGMKPEWFCHEIIPMSFPRMIFFLRAPDGGIFIDFYAVRKDYLLLRQVLLNQ